MGPRPPTPQASFDTPVRTTLVALAIALVATLPTFAAEPGAASGEPPLANVVLVSIDSLRADHLSLYGYPRETMPDLTRRARREGATVFTRMSAVSPSCHPSHASMLTGLYPQQIGVPFCGEDLVASASDLATPDDVASLVDYQKELQAQPPALVRKKVSAVMNWLRIPEGTETLATYLHSRGFETGGFISIWTIEGRFGYSRGFDRFVDDLPEYYGPKPLAWLLRDTMKSQRRQSGEATVDAALDFLGEIPRDRRFFLFVHFADTHVPYIAPPRKSSALREAPPFAETPAERARVTAAWKRRYTPEAWARASAAMSHGEKGEGGFLLDRYDRAIRYVDSQLERLFRGLEAAGHGGDTLIVVTADHGDSFGEHTYLSSHLHNKLFFEHSLYLWEETQHVPLLVFDPAREGPGVAFRQVDASHVDLVPTILDRLGFDPATFGSGNLPGKDLLELPEEARTVYFLTFGRGRPGLLRDLHLDYPKFVGLRSGNLKFFVDRDRFKNPDLGRCFLFDLATDPQEQRNLCGTEASRQEDRALRERLVEWYGRSVSGRGEGPASPARRRSRR